MSVCTAGPQPQAPDLSEHCRTSTASSRSQSALPDPTEIWRSRLRSGSAYVREKFGIDARLPEQNVTQNASDNARMHARIHARKNARTNAKMNVTKNARMNARQNGRIACQQRRRQNARIECQIECQKEFQNRCQIEFISQNITNNARQNARVNFRIDARKDATYDVRIDARQNARIDCQNAMSDRMPGQNVRKYMPYMLPDEMSETLTNILCHGGGDSKESNFVLRGKHC